MRVRIVFACIGLLLIAIAAPVAGTADSEMLSAEKTPSRNNQMSCAERIKEFVSELDILLGQNPNTLEPFSTLLQKYFPLTGCDIKEVTGLTQKSKYFISLYQNGHLTVFSFSNARPGFGFLSGFDVIFAISKLTGDTELPFAKIHKGN